MSRKNHKMIDGRLLQTDKRFDQLKMKQREKIAAWYYEAYRDSFFRNKRLPDRQEDERILDSVMEQIESAGIWIPEYEVEQHFSSKKSKIAQRVLHAYGQDTDYSLVTSQAASLIEADAHFVPLFANVSALLHEAMGHLNWVGFYLVTAEGNLVVGPFQGKPACIHIKNGSGVCGTALSLGKTVVVPNVHEFPGHIACDAASLSEIVVPIRDSMGTVRAVLDIDSPIEGRFFDRDRENLERLCALLGRSAIWTLE